MKTFSKYVKKFAFSTLFFSIFFLSSCNDGVLVSPKPTIGDVINDVPSAQQQVISLLIGDGSKAWNFSKRVIKDVLHEEVSVYNLLSMLLLSQIENLLDQTFPKRIIFDALGKYVIKNALDQVVETGIYVVNELGNVLTLIPKGKNQQQVFDIKLISDTKLQLFGSSGQSLNIDLDLEVETILVKVELLLTAEGI